ncbi:MAG: hypothetical protein LBE36_13755 [Flavobacteriaceae bacterium]|jgi:hypothetical protein|nr:hypothetical protein [Flavobacteriaceae bacterium]
MDQEDRETWEYISSDFYLEMMGTAWVEKTKENFWAVLRMKKYLNSLSEEESYRQAQAQAKKIRAERIKSFKFVDVKNLRRDLWQGFFKRNKIDVFSLN